MAVLFSRVNDTSASPGFLLVIVSHAGKMTKSEIDTSQLEKEKKKEIPFGNAISENIDFSSFYRR